ALLRQPACPPRGARRPPRGAPTRLAKVHALSLTLLARHHRRITRSVAMHSSSLVVTDEQRSVKFNNILTTLPYSGTIRTGVLNDVPLLRPRLLQPRPLRQHRPARLLPLRRPLRASGPGRRAGPARGLSRRRRLLHGGLALHPPRPQLRHRSSGR